jgi:hypothetical protein
MNGQPSPPTAPPPAFAVFLLLQRSQAVGDVDVLIPTVWLTDGWPAVQTLMAALQFVLVDAREHAFRRGADEVAFADEGSLGPFAGIDPARLHTASVAGVCFKELTLQDYLAVYRAAHQDGYRRDQRGKRDAAKIAQIEAWLAQREPDAPNG